MLLRNHWLYLGLGAVVVLLHVQVLMRARHPVAPPSVEQLMATRPPSGRDLLELERGLKERIEEASHTSPGLVLLLAWWGVVATGFALTGLVLSAWAIWRRQLPALWRYRSRLPSRWSFGDLARLIALLGLVAMLLPFVHLALLAWNLPQFHQSRLWSVLGMFILDGLLILLAWGFAATRSMTLSSSFGFSRQRAPRVLAVGFLGYTAAFPWITGLLWGVVQLSQRFGIPPTVETIHELLFLEHQGLALGLTLILACLVGPIAEEIFFRGILFATLRSRCPRLVAMLISGSLFAAVHTNLIGFLPILALGCLLADLYERTGSLLAPIAVHMVHNTFLVGFVLTLRALAGL